MTLITDPTDADNNDTFSPRATTAEPPSKNLERARALTKKIRIPNTRHLGLAARITLALAVGVFITGGLDGPSHPPVSDTPAPVPATAAAPPEVTSPPQVTAAVATPHYSSKSTTLDRGGNLMQLLVGQGVKRAEAYRAITAVTKIYDVRRIRAGTSVDVVFLSPADPAKPRVLDKVVIAAAADRKVIAQRATDGGFTADNEFADLKVSTVRVAGTISNSLYLSARQAGLADSVIVDAIRIFSYDVDFQREVRNGDRFEVLFERYHDDHGQPVKEGNILYASLTLSGKKIDLYRHAPSDTKRTEYFHATGQTARKALMRTPIDGARLTSGYGKRRHPILGYRKMHRGLDFGARRGTPIMAAGDGVIDRIGRNGGYGNYIRIRHNGTYSTAYAHMNGFRKGLRRGKRVTQGQIIGYVGSTGRSTGPHLHYEVLKNGHQMNPLKVKMPTGRKLKGKMLAEFKSTVAETRIRLAEAPLQTLVASAQ